MTPLLADLVGGTLDLVFAPTCLACGNAIPAGQAERRICLRCWARARPLPAPRCPRCWTPVPLRPSDGPPACRECASLRPAVRALRSAFLMAGPVRDIVHAFKYGGWHSLAGPLAGRMATLPWPREVEEEARRVVPVPLSPGRLRQRGYNQAELLARRFAELRGLRCEPEALVRRRAAGTQTTLHPGERRANVAGAFAGGPAAGRIGGEHLVLVDDVWTTGATALAAVHALLEEGARAVSVLTFARAIPEVERERARLEAAATF